MSDNKPKFYDFVSTYDFTCELPGSKETVQFKPVTTGQIKKLLTYENETNYVVQEQALDDLVTSSVLSEGFDIDEQYIYDRLFLLIEIRKKTKGEVLEFQVKCPECNSQSLNRVNLDELEIKQLENSEPVVVELGQIKVHLRHMKRKHQKQDIKPNMFPKNMTPTQQGYMFQVAFHACAIDKIETPNGIDENISMKDRIYFIEQIPMQHMEILKEKIDDMSFGWQLQQKVKCIHCNFEHVNDIPIQQNFFG
jgi:hypothetical protein